MKLTWIISELIVNDLTLESPLKSEYKLSKSTCLEMRRVAWLRLDKFVNSYFLGENEVSTIRRTSSDGALICTGQMLDSTTGINKQMNTLFNEGKETILIACFMQSCKTNSSRRGQRDRKLARSYSRWSSMMIELNTISWRWRIFSDGKHTSEEELSLGWVLPRNFKTTSDLEMESLRGNKVGFSMDQQSNSSSSTLRSNAFETHKCISYCVQPLSL